MANNKPVNLEKVILITIVLILLAGNIFFGLKYFAAQKELAETEQALATQKFNEGILNFTKLFIVKVLKAETEIDFETRLQLETAVRDLDDEQVLAQWQKFIESQTEAQAQTEVKNLLELLTLKIQIK